MKVAMLYPTVASENAISNYSLDLVEAMSKTDIQFQKGEYTFHKPLTLFKQFSKLKQNDIIHIQHEYNILGWKGTPFFPLLFFLKFFFRGKVILTMHTVPSQKAEFEGTKIKSFMRKIFYSIQNKWIKLFSDHILVHCDYFKQILIDEYHFNEKKIDVLPQAVKEDLMPSREKSRKELNISGNTFLVIGTFDPDHGAGDVVKQADKINGQILIVTNPSPNHPRNKKKVLEYLEYVKKLAERPELKKNIRFDLKEIPFDLWWKYFAASDIVLLPYHGGLGSGIFSDAIALKIPMVGSDIPYFREYHKKYGIIELARRGDFSFPINEVMKKNNYQKMKKIMNDYVNEFGVNHIGNKYKEIYKKMLI